MAVITLPLLEDAGANIPLIQTGMIRPQQQVSRESTGLLPRIPRWLLTYVLPWKPQNFHRSLKQVQRLLTIPFDFQWDNTWADPLRGLG